MAWLFSGAIAIFPSFRVSHARHMHTKAKANRHIFGEVAAMDVFQSMRTSDTFTVANLMIPLRSFVRAKNATDAPEVFQTNPDIDLLPMPLKGAPTRVIFRRDMSEHQIDIAMLISESTPIRELPRLFARYEAFFILGSHKISGLVHFSDLNKPVSKITFFAMFEQVERKYLEAIKKTFNRTKAAEVFNRATVGKIYGRVGIAAANGALPYEAAAMMFSEMLRFCIYVGCMKITPPEMDLIIDFRNRVAHAGRPLITSREDCANLVSVQRICARLIARNVQSET